eukprot:793539-Alexandrium_andersonii.AAC.1
MGLFHIREDIWNRHQLTGLPHVHYRAMGGGPQVWGLPPGGRHGAHGPAGVLAGRVGQGALRRRGHRQRHGGGAHPHAAHPHRHHHSLLRNGAQADQVEAEPAGQALLRAGGR